MRAISIWPIFIEFSFYYNGLHVTDIDKVVIYILFMIFGGQMGISYMQLQLHSCQLENSTWAMRIFKYVQTKSSEREFSEWETYTSFRLYRKLEEMSIK